ncbi:MAG: carboxypeptidase M32, partial [Candidatus Eisenbacteria bacterium]
YTIGNVLSAQLFQAGLRANPGIPDEIRRGEFGTLRAWLRENVYRHGSKFTADEIVQRATGGALTTGPYLDYLWGKYQPLYGLRSEERQPVSVG